jgi:hypothetical protein
MKLYKADACVGQKTRGRDVLYAQSTCVWLQGRPAASRQSWRGVLLMSMWTCLRARQTLAKGEVRKWNPSVVSTIVINDTVA